MKYEYDEYQFSSKSTYIRKDSYEKLAEIDTIIMDCDGVLLDTREAYRQAAGLATKILVESFTESEIPVTLFDDELNYRYKRTGGFNNDWDLVYALTLCILSQSEKLNLVNSVAEKSLKINDIGKRLDFIKSTKNKPTLPTEHLYELLESFAEKLDSRGVTSVDELLPQLNTLKKAFNHPGDVGESVIATLFEELLEGTALFQKSFGLPTVFVSHEKGFIEQEKIIIKNDTLQHLISKLGENRLGIVSGSMSGTAEYKLGNVLFYFNREGVIWQDQVLNYMKDKDEKDLSKPNPFSLLEAVSAFTPFNRVLYIGDTSADYVMSVRAGDKFSFMGVYGFAPAPIKTLSDFLAAGCDVVSPSVNELPSVIGEVRRMIK